MTKTRTPNYSESPIFIISKEISNKALVRNELAVLPGLLRGLPIPLDEEGSIFLAVAVSSCDYLSICTLKPPRAVPFVLVVSSYVLIPICV